ncbi:hypothetical protein [Novosphingobium sp. Leaf2]|nr:hypothetical protein [Novosphingobium sp. Leaf2]
MTGPITDTLAFRVSGVSTRRDGVIDNIRTGAKENAGLSWPRQVIRARSA